MKARDTEMAEYTNPVFFVFSCFRGKSSRSVLRKYAAAKQPPQR